MSKGLEALDVLYRKYSNDDDFLEDDKLFATIEKELKALEILRHHKEAINDELLWYKSKKQEYKLVKEVLKNE